MKFKLPRQIISQDINRIISREMKRQKMPVYRVTKNHLKELAAVSKAIEENGLPSNLVCKKLPHNLGRGIFLHPDAKPILKGQLIGSYAGEISLIVQNQYDDGSYAFTPLEDILLKKEEQLLFDKGSLFRPRRLYSLKVDALKDGNFTRYINHSDKPNVVADVYKIPANSYGLAPALIEIFYVAKRTIHPGEQLLVSYEDGGESYWRFTEVKPFPMTPKTFTLTADLQIRVAKKLNGKA